MKTSFRSALATIVLLALSIASAAQQKAPAANKPAAGAAKQWKQLTFPSLRDVKLPEIKRYTLANGIRLFVVEDHRLPLVEGFAMIRVGSRWEPPEKTGLASMTGQVMRTGGTKSKTGDQLDEELEASAASVECSIGQTSGTAGFSALKGDEDRVLAIFADVLMNPEFRQDKIDLQKNMARTSISRRNDDAGSIASREFRKLLYGPQSPYARHSEYATIAAIQRGDLAAFHRRFYHPNNVMIGVSGDVNPDEIRQKIEKVFAAWKPAPDLRLPPIPEAAPRAAAPVNFVRKEDVNQSNVYIGHLGGMYKDSDYFSLEVMAQILGAGGFSSRMFKRIRSEMGLAYHASADWSADYDHRGTFNLYVGTKSETTAKAIEAAMREMREIREKEVTEEELKVAKESILNSFVFNFANPAQVMRRIMTYIYYGYPEDFLQQYKANIEKVARADVLRVAKKHLNPEGVTLLVVGNDKEFDKPLAQLAMAAGKINQIDVTIPTEKPAAASAPAGAASPAALERGRAIFEMAQKAVGGAERLRALKDVSMVNKGKASTPMGEIEVSGRETYVFAGGTTAFRTEQVLPFGTITMFFDGAKGWVNAPQGFREMPENMKQAFRGQVIRNTYTLLRGEGEFAVQFEKRDKVGGKDADVILVTKGGESVRLFVDPASGLVLKKGYRGTDMGGAPADIEELYSDFRDVDGVKVPFGLVVNQNGNKFLEGGFTEVKFNTGADPAELAKKPTL